MADARDVSRLSDEQLENAVFAARRLKAIRESRRSLIAFSQLTMPDPEHPNDAAQSMYQVGAHHRLLAEIMEKVVAGELTKNVAISMPPQHGKSQQLTRNGPAWALGRKPWLQIMVGAYNEDKAMEFGNEVNAIMDLPTYSAIFPDIHRTEKSASSIAVRGRGRASFVGVGGSGTGKPADVFIVDDPIKNDDDARSETYREKVWNWYTKVVSTRCHNKSVIVVVHCMVGSTPVLMADATTKALRDVRTGDAIATLKDGRVSTSFVTNWANQGVDPVFRITMSSGITVTANERHPFLVERDGESCWTKLRDLKSGDVLLSVTERGAEKHAAKTGVTNPSALRDIVPITTSGRDTLRVTGRIPARCSLPNFGIDTALTLIVTTPCLQNKRDVAPSVAGFRMRPDPQPLGREDLALTTATRPAKSGVFCATRVISSSDGETPTTRRSDFVKPLSTYVVTRDTIVDISAAGAEEVFDIEVLETENFIANGLVSHNTRWHEDDLIGRLCDPNHPERKGRFEGIEEDWIYIDLPAVVTDEALAQTLGLKLEVPTAPAIIKQFGEKPMAALWSDRQNLERHARLRRQDRVGFDALYMGKPSPDEGIDFKDTMMSTYRADELPTNLIYYGASDHATGIKQTNDPNCLGCVGIDNKDNIYVLPDIVWKRMATDQTVESMLDQMKRYRPYVWWMENELISKSFGPFLKKRMLETSIYCTLDPVTVAVDKMTRSRAIHARMSMNKVLFPVFAPWWEAARSEMLRFPNGAHDDFVDWLAHIGNGLAKQYKASPDKSDNDNVIVTGSLKWILADTRRKARQAILTDSLWLSKGRSA